MILQQNLKRLAAMQERYRLAHLRYAPALDLLRFSPSDDVRIEVVGATVEGWGAVATHRYLAGKSCVIYGGVMDHPPRTLQRRRLAGHGVVICDDV